MADHGGQHSPPQPAAGRRSLRLLKVVMGIDPSEGGTTEVILTTTAGEIEAGAAVTLVTPSTGTVGEKRNVRSLHSTGAQVLLFPLSGSGLARRWAISPSLLVWLIRNVRRFDVVHIHGAWGLVPLGALFLVRMRRMPSVLTVHEALTDYDLGQTARRYLVPVKRVGRPLLLGLAKHLIVASELERRDTAPSRARVLVIPHPVGHHASATSHPARSASSAIGFIGRFHPKKNLPLLLEALSDLPGIQLVVAGHGDEAVVRNLRSLAARLGVSERVTWLGWVGPEERAAFYGRIDVLAMPSTYECYGMVAAEAMANGTPVVVTKTTGAAELARASRAGIVTSHDTAEIAAALARFLTDTDLREAAALRASRFAAQRLTSRTYGETVLGLYLQLRRAGAPE